ncbi:MAG TPA: LytTR family transcriptional regulator [Porphyromonadaceae bacterium]|jgi:hypothetical protein|uniref:LytR/AlgR family response regulator transcription factor n=1 Tax=Limibacterium fermenti TaxID=3229863 RepID=UPI000E87FA46|nr:LytTR family transcriptional regulator [Porphyromonadaceae bacterium]HBK30420.1 LytTR family transcriptional regulator [Porphyromonadaceae bacterium]HBL34794.1 LytTR family transcriptional regulator [Porphyromonadaceae bacterium]HBX19624.1 LytTR family transcriptional regulator [Porphyromonadaceae bacterium]HBX44946.1 LytTR family transcriptional regulator [Porphyromonadaceae bacterium]
MNNTIPAFLYQKDNTVKMIVFTALFALLFINIFQPFGSRSWYPNISDISYFAFSSLIILIGMLVVVISRIIMAVYSKKHGITYWQFAAWVLVEILAMALFYALFARFVPKDGGEKDFINIFRGSAINTGLILLLPYSISWLYFSWKDNNAKLQTFKRDEANELRAKSLIAFPDEKGDMKISIMLENLLYIDSADNYATIHYLNKSTLSQFLIRNSLKWMDENLTAETPLVRCHRSYMVNLDQVKVVKKTKEGIILELNTEGTPDIPVSKTYYERFMDKFMEYSV